MKARHRFTLIEMLVCLCILVVLAGMTFGIMKRVWQSNADAQTRATVSAIQAGVDAYKLKKGYYPQMSANPADINAHRLRLSTVKSWGVDTGNMKTDGTYVIDFYKTPLRYRCPGIVNPHAYDVWSAGKDKKDGLNTGNLATALTRAKTDDITNW